MKTKARIVHITTVHHPHDPRIYYKQCISAQKADFETFLIAQETTDQLAEDVGVKHVQLKSYKSRLKRMLFGTWEAYKKAKKLRADIYVFHDPELMVVGSLLKKKHNIVIYDIHEDYVTSILQKEYLSKPFKLIIARLYRFLEKWLTRKMELSLAEKYYQELYPRGKTILNYPIINEKLLKVDRSKQPIVDKLLYTGNVTEDRGALIHAKIPSILPKVSVQFVGKCDKELAERMRERAGDHKDKLYFEGIDQFVVKEKIENYYVKENWLAGIALFPPTEHYMKKELTKFFEYMNVGLPIICSNFPAWQAFIEKYKCGIAVDPYDDDAIVKAIETLRDNPELKRQLGENGRRAIANELNWQMEEAKLIDWYHELLDRLPNKSR